MKRISMYFGVFLVALIYLYNYSSYISDSKNYISLEIINEILEDDKQVDTFYDFFGNLGFEKSEIETVIKNEQKSLQLLLNKLNFFEKLSLFNYYESLKINDVQIDTLLRSQTEYYNSLNDEKKLEFKKNLMNMIGYDDGK